MIHARIDMTYGAFSLNVDLQLPGRGVSALFGDSGSGKTTCLRCLAGLSRAANAYIEVNGEVWQDSARGIFVAPHKRALGYVFQEASLFEHLSVRRNLEYGWRRIRPEHRKVGLDQACSLLGIDHLLERQPAHLSGGERQRVGIARALLTSPRLLLMDEPLAALDSRRKGEILPYLERLHDDLEIPVVYVSHAQDEVARLADHLVVLEQGRVLASGPLGSTLARLDLPMALEADAGVVVQARVQSYDPTYQLLSLQLPGAIEPMRVAHELRTAGETVRIKIQARDVSLSLSEDDASSILNRFAVTVEQVSAAHNPAHVQLSLRAGETLILARITRFSADQLGVVAGLQAWAQIKAVAVLA